MLIFGAVARVVPSPAGSSYLVERQEPYGTTLTDRRLTESLRRFSWAEGLDPEPLRSLLLRFAGRNLIAVGSGGSHAAALFAAQLHESTFGSYR